MNKNNNGNNYSNCAICGYSKLINYDIIGIKSHYMA